MTAKAAQLMTKIIQKTAAVINVPKMKKKKVEDNNDNVYAFSNDAVSGGIVES